MTEPAIELQAVTKSFGRNEVLRGVTFRVERGKTFEKTWDHFLMPFPFSRAVILFCAPIEVPPNADSEAMAAKHAEMQRELERVRDIAESWFSLNEPERQRHREAFSR